MNQPIIDGNQIPPPVWDRYFQLVQSNGGEEPSLYRAVNDPSVSLYLSQIQDAMKNGIVPEAVAERARQNMIGDGDRQRLLSNPNHPELVQSLIQPDPRFFGGKDIPQSWTWAMIHNTAIKPETLKWVMDTYPEGFGSRNFVASHPNLTPEMANEMFDKFIHNNGKGKPFLSGLDNLANNEKLPEQTLLKMLSSPYLHAPMWASAVRRPDVTPATISKMMDLPSGQSWQPGNVETGDKLSAMGRIFDDPELRKKFVTPEIVDKIIDNPDNHSLLTSYQFPTDAITKPEQFAKLMSDAPVHQQGEPWFLKINPSINDLEMYGDMLSKQKFLPKEYMPTLMKSPDPMTGARAAVRYSPETARQAYADSKNPKDAEGNPMPMDEAWQEHMDKKIFANPDYDVPEDILTDIATRTNLGGGSVELEKQALEHPNMTNNGTLQLLRSLAAHVNQKQMAANPGVPLDQIKRNVPPSSRFLTSMEDLMSTGKIDDRHVQELLNFMPGKFHNSVGHNPQDLNDPIGRFQLDMDHLLGVANDEQAKEIVNRYADMPATQKMLEDKLYSAGRKPTPDPRVQVSFGTHRLRTARQHIENAGGQMHNNELAALGLDLKKMGHGKLVDPKGLVTAKAISQHIDSLPKLEYGVTHSEWNGIQRHVRAPQPVFQLNATEHHLRQMAQQGLLPTYRATLGDTSAHPRHDTRGAGWVRYNVGTDGKVHIDEVQSDFSEGGQVFQMLKREAERNPEARKQMDNLKKIHKILWGSKNPTDVLHEAFLQHMRDQGRAGNEVHIWDVNTKNHPSLMSTNPDRPPPAHAVNTYKNFPEKVGYEPAKYGEAQTQYNQEHVGKPTYKITLTKTEEIEAWLSGLGMELQKNLGGDDVYRDFMYRWELPTKVMLGDTYDFPEFRAAKMLAPNRRFNEDAYRESMRLYNDDMIWAAIYAYGLPRDKSTYNQVKSLMELHV